MERPNRPQAPETQEVNVSTLDFAEVEQHLSEQGLDLYRKLGFTDKKKMEKISPGELDTLKKQLLDGVEADLRRMITSSLQTALQQREKRVGDLAEGRVSQAEADREEQMRKDWLSRNN